jgi:2-dehydro-3-deoxygluconokinase
METRAPTYDLLAVGESMAMVTPAVVESLSESSVLRLDVGGAESNVALHLARLGNSVAWASSVGDDPLGRRILATIAAGGVDTSLVTVDPTAPTGVYFKDPAPTGTRVYYYRAGSAASRLGPESLAGIPIASARMVHLSGITPALSDSCAALVDAIFDEARRLGIPVSFDINYRAGLWSVEAAGPVLRRLAERADLVFVGRDEAEVLWGTPAAADIRALLPSCERLIVKDGAVGATEFIGETETFVDAPVVEVVEPVGAGDAFAAGYLAAVLRGDTSRDALAHGHTLAGLALTSVIDFELKG